MIVRMVITFESGPLKGKVIEVADDTLEYEVELLSPATSLDPTAPVKTTRLRYRRSNYQKSGATVFYAHAS